MTSVHFTAESAKGVRTITSKLTTDEHDALVGAAFFGRGRWLIADSTTIATRFELRRKCLLRHSGDYLTRLGTGVRYTMLMEGMRPCSGSTSTSTC